MIIDHWCNTKTHLMENFSLLIWSFLPINYMILPVTVTFFFPEINETICWLMLGKIEYLENVTFFLTKISAIHCSYTRNRIENNKMFDKKDPNVNYRTRAINEELILCILVFFIAIDFFFSYGRNMSIGFCSCSRFLQCCLSQGVREIITNR